MSQTRSAQTSKIPRSGSKTAQGSSELSVPVTSIRKVEADGVRVFYRVAGDPGPRSCCCCTGSRHLPSCSAN